MHTAHIFGKLNRRNGIISVVMLKRCSKQYRLLISHSKLNMFFTVVQQPPVSQGLLISEDSRSHSDTPQSVAYLSNTFHIIRAKEPSRI